MNYFVISDIHGHLDDLNELLQQFESSKQQLVLLGDYIDRGPKSFGVLTRIKELKEQYPSTILLKGNHEALFLQFLKGEMDVELLNRYLTQYGGNNTIESFVGDMVDTFNKERLEERLKLVREEILSANKDLIRLIEKDLLYFYETEHILFTHAGYNTSLADWKKTTNDDFIWIRRHYKSPSKTHHINVFGHTPTNMIRKEMKDVETFEPLLIEQRRGAYLAIDGARGFGGQLNGVVLNEKGHIVKRYCC